jgi:hypothetical protein
MMMDTNAYFSVRGTISERKAAIANMTREQLEATILDTEYNRFLSERADFGKDEADTRGHGKRLPYIGWFWRHLPFSSGSLPIGDSGEVVGFIANNKWSYEERETTPEEFARIMEIIDEAMRINSAGGILSEIVANTNKKLDELWEYMQTLTI